MMSATPYAIYQAGYAIYGVGVTLTAAKCDAAEWLDDPETALDTLTVLRTGRPGGEIHGALYARPCTARLLAEVAAHGGDIVYEVNSEGLLDLKDETDDDAPDHND